jgi:hypothetical protein
LPCFLISDICGSGKGRSKASLEEEGVEETEQQKEKLRRTSFQEGVTHPE